MLSQKIYRIIKGGIQDGTYKRIRLVRDNGERELLITYSGYVRGGEESTIKRLDYIKNQLDRILSPGTYIIECSTVPNGNTGLVDSFKVIKSPVSIPISSSENGNGTHEDNIEDHSQQQENMQEFDLEDYKELLDKNADLRVIVEVQKLEISHLKQQLEQRPLNDPGQGSSIIKMIEEHAPSVMSIFDTFLKQKDKALELKDREISLAENGHTMNGHKKKIVRMQKQKTKEEILSDMEQLCDRDEASFNATMEEMKIKDPDLHNYIMEEMFEDDQQQEQN